MDAPRGGSFQTQCGERVTWSAIPFVSKFSVYEVQCLLRRVLNAQPRVLTNHGNSVLEI